MVIPYEAVGDLMDEIADSFPKEFYKELNGAVLLLPEIKRHPTAQELVIMGTYCRDQVGRRIELYYGSFAHLAEREGWSEAQWRKQLWGTLSHEFTHHLESLAGERGLEIKDAQFMARYWHNKKRTFRMKHDA